MSTCFIMQPFDKDVFDKRYEDIFEPAIISCGLVPYRVDRDPSVNIPIDEIESGIRKARICFAEITTDNPNVWFELGYAIACNKDVIMVCSDERVTRFPFDVQHRNIIKYSTKSPRDYEKLTNDIKERMNAILQKQVIIDELNNSPVSDIKGLSNFEIMVLTLTMSSQINPNDIIHGYSIKQDMNRNGYTDSAYSLGIRKLILKGMIEQVPDVDYNGNEYYGYRLTDLGEEWLMNNEDKLVLRQEIAIATNDDEDDGLPF